MKSILQVLMLSTMAVVPAVGSEFFYQSTPDAFDPANDLAFGTGVSADGSVAMGFINGTNAPPGYIWTPEEGFQSIPTPAEINSSNRFIDVSHDGSVLLGGGWFQSSDRSEYRPYLWTPSEGFTFLPTTEGATRERVHDLSGDGSTVLGQTDTDETTQYWTWDKQSGRRILPYDGELRTPQELLNDGATLVASGGVLNLEDETTFVLPNSIEDRNPTITDASNDGKIVVGWVPVDATHFEAMRWEVGSETVEVFGTLDYPHHTDSRARGVSSDGKVVVGYSSAPRPDLDGRAFVWDELNGMRELEDVFRNEYGMEDLHAWGIGVANQISDDRRTVVGSIREGRKASGSPGDMWVARLDWPLGSIRSDFDLDDTLDPDDADLLVTAILEGNTDPLYDLDSDEVVGVGDLSELLIRAGRRNGDANFDGEVNFADFLTLSANFGEAGLWSQGDFDATGDVGFADFLALSANFGTVVEATASVPEPSFGPFLLVFPLLLLSLRSPERPRCDCEHARQRTIDRHAV